MTQMSRGQLHQQQQAELRKLQTYVRKITYHDYPYYNYSDIYVILTRLLDILVKG